MAPSFASSEVPPCRQYHSFKGEFLVIYFQLFLVLIIIAKVLSRYLFFLSLKTGLLLIAYSILPIHFLLPLNGTTLEWEERTLNLLFASWLMLLYEEALVLSPAKAAGF